MDAIEQIKAALVEYDAFRTNKKRLDEELNIGAFAIGTLRKIRAALKAAAEQEPFGWIQAINGEVTQNFARDERELELFKSTAILLGREKGVQYLPLYTHPIASEDSERLDWLDAVRREVEDVNGDGGFGDWPVPTWSVSHPTAESIREAIDAARREGK